MDIGVDHPIIQTLCRCSLDENRRICTGTRRQDSGVGSEGLGPLLGYDSTVNSLLVHEVELRGGARYHDIVRVVNIDPSVVSRQTPMVASFDLVQEIQTWIVLKAMNSTHTQTHSKNSTKHKKYRANVSRSPTRTYSPCHKFQYCIRKPASLTHVRVFPIPITTFFIRLGCETYFG